MDGAVRAGAATGARDAAPRRAQVPALVDVNALDDAMERPGAPPGYTTKAMAVLQVIAQRFVVPVVDKFVLASRLVMLLEPKTCACREGEFQLRLVVESQTDDLNQDLNCFFCIFQLFHRNMTSRQFSSTHIPADGSIDRCDILLVKRLAKYICKF